MTAETAPSGKAAGRVPVGIEGLDDVLGGGFVPNRLYLIEGTPGAGKTTLAMQFLLRGEEDGEAGLYITLSERAEELAVAAASHGWSMDAFSTFELGSAESLIDSDREMTLLHPWEVELGETIGRIEAEIERLKPRRIVFDSLSEMRLLTQDPLRYRRQILALKEYFADKNCTVLLLDDKTRDDHDLQLRSICHGVLTLEHLPRDYGSERRRLRIVKMRAAQYRGGYHDYIIRPGGIVVFPRLIAAEHADLALGAPLRSNIDELDRLLDGGPLHGTTTLLVGAAGTGKTTLSVQYMQGAIAHGERAAIFSFDERIGTLLTRSAKLGMDLKPHIDAGNLFVDQIDPAELSPGEFVQKVRDRVEKDGARVLVIDSLNGYLQAMPQEQALVLQMHELLTFLNQKQVASFLISNQHGLIGNVETSFDISYLADAVLLLRYFEAEGRVHKALSVIKNRTGAHEETIRELRVGSHGIQVGAPLTGFHGVLSGVPSYVGRNAGGASLLPTGVDDGTS